MIEREVFSFTAHADVDVDTGEIIRMVLITEDGERFNVSAEQIATGYQLADG